LQKQFDMVNKDRAEEGTVLPGQGLSTEANREIFQGQMFNYSWCPCAKRLGEVTLKPRVVFELGLHKAFGVFRCHVFSPCLISPWPLTAWATVISQINDQIFLTSTLIFHWHTCLSQCIEFMWWLTRFVMMPQLFISIW